MRPIRYLQYRIGHHQTLRFTLVAAILVAAGASACGGEGATGPEEGSSPPVGSISVEPDSTKITAIGASTDYSAQAFDQQGNLLSDVEFDWSLADGSVATVDSTGTVTSDGNGRTAVIAEAGGVADSATVVVVQKATNVQVTPSEDSVFALQDTVNYSANVSDAEGNTIDTLPVTWSAVDRSIADVDSTGASVAVGPGKTGIVAEVNEVSDTASFIVDQRAESVAVTPGADTATALEDTLSFTATAQDSNSFEIVNNNGLRWTSTELSVAEVDSVGNVVAVGNGSARVAASMDGASDTASVLVDQEVANVSVTPSSDTVPSVGDTLTFSAEAFDANGNRVADATFSWSAGDSSTVKPLSSGTYESAYFGFSEVLAFAEGVKGRASSYVGVMAFTRGSNSEIVKVAVGGSTSTELTSNFDLDTSPSWSPDGSRIGFDSDRDGDRDIYTMSATGRDVRQVTDDPSSDLRPAWSPLDDQIAFDSNRDGNREVYIVNTDGTGVTNLTQNSAGDLMATWSPDGTRIAFASDRSGNLDIWTMDADGSNVSQVTSNSATDSWPAWSPGGGRIAFRSDRDGDTEIYTVRPDGTDLQQVTNNSVFDSSPAWSPSGAGIAFSSRRASDDTEIFIIRPDGTDPVRVTEYPGLDNWPSMQP